ncbi:MAG: hypothetical protein AAF311_01645 [Pseudomonadota bacterium]
MKLLVRPVLLMSMIAVAGCTSADAPTPAASLEGPFFAVIHTAGPQVERLFAEEEMRDAHRGLYTDFASECLTLFGGAYRGGDPLGITVFRHGVDEDALRTRVEADPAVTAGAVAIAYRSFDFQHGQLFDRTDCTPETNGALS